MPLQEMKQAGHAGTQRLTTDCAYHQFLLYSRLVMSGVLNLYLAESQRRNVARFKAVVQPCWRRPWGAHCKGSTHAKQRHQSRIIFPNPVNFLLFSQPGFIDDSEHNGTCVMRGVPTRKVRPWIRTWLERNALPRSQFATTSICKSGFCETHNSQKSHSCPPNSNNMTNFDQALRVINWPPLCRLVDTIITAHAEEKLL